MTLLKNILLPTLAISSIAFVNNNANAQQTYPQTEYQMKQSQGYVYGQSAHTNSDNYSYRNVISKTPMYFSGALTVGGMKYGKTSPSGQLNPSTNGVGFDLAVGQYMSDRWRGQISLGYTNYTGDKSAALSKVELDNSMFDLMFSTEYDLIKMKSFSFFYGVGAGVGFNNSKMISTVGPVSASDKSNSVNAQVALSLGMNISVSDTIDLFAKYSYTMGFAKNSFNIAGVDSSYSNPDKQDVKVGIRYKF